MSGGAPCVHDWAPIDAPNYRCNRCGWYGWKRAAGRDRRPRMVAFSPEEFARRNAAYERRGAARWGVDGGLEPLTTAPVDAVVAGRRRP